MDLDELNQTEVNLPYVTEPEGGGLKRPTPK
jgi:hypothetical protein